MAVSVDKNGEERRDFSEYSGGLATTYQNLENKLRMLQVHIKQDQESFTASNKKGCEDDETAIPVDGIGFLTEHLTTG